MSEKVREKTKKNSKFLKHLQDDFVFFDGSMGALLQSLELKTPWKTPEQLLFLDPESIINIHTQYLEAGANVILTNTFGANRLKLSEYDLDAQQTILIAIELAQKARNSRPEWKDRFIAYDIGPTGQLMEPMGSLSFDDAYEVFKEIAIAAEKGGADLVCIETMSDIYELKACVLAIKENTSLPIIASATFLDTNLMLTGAKVQTLVTTMEALGVDAVGFNCGSSLENARILAKAFVESASIPVFVEPNAGIPVVENGKTVFKVDPKEFAETMHYCASIGARILGGCCGTTPLHIAETIKSCASLKLQPIHDKNVTRISSWVDFCEISETKGPVIIGERINPTGKKKFKQALLDQDMDYVLAEAQKQIDAGAHILDVNVGLPGIDEAQVMIDAVKALQSTYTIPLQIDSSEPAVLERALRYYNGKALVNSVNGKKAVMEEVFPIVKKYGGVLVALALDEEGIAPTAEGRLAVAQKIVTTAESYGIAKKDIIIDSLVMTVSSQQKEALETIRAIPLIKQTLNVHTVLGVSNISFGLPERELVNSVFFGAALNAGLDACIINPLSDQMMAVYRSYRALKGYDENCLEYIDFYSKHPFALTTKVSSQSELASVNASPQAKSESPANELSLRSIIIQGLREQSRAACEDLLKTLSPVQIIDEHIVPALDEVGKDYEKGRKFLPQLLMSADTVSRAFEVIKERLAQSGSSTQSKGKILMATVSGDIHDIGKNIVKALLENYGYSVIDLGKDVPIEKVVEIALKEKPGIIGLSALMTTTVANMEKTIVALRNAKITSPIMVGGAVLTEDYAYTIGAQFYAKDAMASVKIAREIFGR